MQNFQGTYCSQVAAILKCGWIKPREYHPSHQRSSIYYPHSCTMHEQDIRPIHAAALVKEKSNPELLVQTQSNSIHGPESW